MHKNGNETRCAICEAYLHSLQGGKCVLCKQRMCRTHLYMKKEGLVCIKCLRGRSETGDLSRT